MQRVFSLFFLFISLSLCAQQQLSDSAEISVLTIGPGTSLNDSFGHSGFRIQDEAKGFDLVFNYGVYDFEAPNFVLKFAQGKLNYLIGLNRFDDFYNAYTEQNRTIKQQTLNLSQVEKQKIFDFLIENYEPENRRYLYDFFFDNCATKIKDVANITCNNTIQFNVPEDYEEATFRTLIQENLNPNSWGSLGIDLALGAVIDQIATPEQHMFLPKNIYSFFENATKGNDDKVPLVKESSTLYSAKTQNSYSNFITSPLFIFGLIGLLIIYITYKDQKQQKRTKALDIVIFTITGFAGVIILLLWFATDHEATHNNYNLLWANPLNLVVLFQLFKSNMSKWFNKYLKFLIILLCLMTFHWVTGVQIFAIGLIPLFIALFIRYAFLTYHLRKL